MKAALFAVALVAVPPMLAPAPAAAQSAERIKRVIVYGREACPRGSGDEIVICGRRPAATAGSRTVTTPCWSPSPAASSPRCWPAP